MNKHDFLSLVGSSAPVERHLLGELNELVNIFPYFHTAHLLLLKGLKDNSDIRFENQLRNSAIHVADREVLYNLLKVAQIPELEEEDRSGEIHLTEEIPESEIIVEEIIKDEPVVDNIPAGEIPADIISGNELIAEEVIQEKSEAGEIKPEESVVPDIVPEYLHSEEAPATEPLSAEIKPEDYDVPDIDQTVIESARNSEEFINEIEKSEQEDSEAGERDVTDLNFERLVLVSVEAEMDEPERSILILDEESSETDQKIFYMDPGFAVPGSDDEDEFVAKPPDTEHQTEEAIAAQEGADHTDEQEVQMEVVADKNLSRQTQADLIDKFIMANPRIEPAREKTAAPAEDLAQQSAEERDTFVTETLARIYINQGYYSRAIDIYEKLSLKFPEKSDYFAAQIEGIKAKIK